VAQEASKKLAQTKADASAAHQRLKRTKTIQD
jgi:hypothetical protein